MEFFSGISIIELGVNVSASACTKLMAALGADVIKVEKPGGGDPARRMGPFPDDVPHPEKSGLFLYLNMGKKGITLDISRRDGQRIFQQLVEKTDIIVEDLGSGVLGNVGG